MLVDLVRGGQTNAHAFLIPDRLNEDSLEWEGFRLVLKLSKRSSHGPNGHGSQEGSVRLSDELKLTASPFDRLHLQAKLFEAHLRRFLPAIRHATRTDLHGRAWVNDLRAEPMLVI